MGLFYTYLGAIDLGLIWGFLALGVYITFRLLDIADLTVDGSFATGGAVCAVCVLNGIHPLLAIIAAIPVSYTHLEWHICQHSIFNCININIST